MEEIKTSNNFQSILNFDLSRALSDAQVDEIEKEETEKRKQQYFEKAVPSRYWNVRVNNYQVTTDKQKEAVTIVSNFIHSVKNGDFKTLVLLGNAGTGKTHLACSCVRECYGVYKNVFEIANEFRSAKSFSTRENETDLIKKYGKIDLLVVDEIGRGFYAEEEKYIIYQIVNERYNNKKPTILISNKKQSEFLEYVGEAVQDRLIESGYIFDFENQSSYRINLRK